MMKLKTLVAGLVVGCASMFAVNAFAGTIMIDLNDFYTEGFVTIEADGSSATLKGDGDGDFSFDDGFLLNDPTDPNYPDPGIPDPQVTDTLISLSFTYLFSEGNGADDEFSAEIWDGATGDSIGDILYVYDTVNTAVTHTWDLATLAPGVTQLGMSFTISEYGGLPPQASTAVISYLTLTTEPSQTGSPVPEPSTMILFGAGLSGLAWVSRKRRVS